MSQVFVDVGTSLDGFIAGLNSRPGNPLGDGGTRIHEWVYSLAAFRGRMGMTGGETGRDNDLLEATMARAGGTTFFFVTDGVASALTQATAAAGHKDVRVSGGPA